MTRIAIVYANDGFGEDVSEGFSSALQTRGVQPAAAASFARPMGDITQQVAAVNKADPQAVLVIGSGSRRRASSATCTRPAARRSSSRCRTARPTRSSRNWAKTPVGSSSREIVPGMNSSQMTLATEYRSLARQQGVQPSSAGMEGFMSAKVLVEGLRRAGADLTRERLVTALENLRDYDLGGILISYSPTRHTGSSFVEMSIVSSTGKLIR
ncbi:ABC transporter substrate-binding protein [Cupriavidus basilensis]